MPGATFHHQTFSIDELMARIRAVLRRTGFATDTTPRHISAPNLEVDFQRSCAACVVSAALCVRTPTEFDIPFAYLVAQANKPVPHRRLPAGRSGSLNVRPDTISICAFLSISSAKNRASGPKTPAIRYDKPRIGVSPFCAGERARGE